MVDPTEPSNDNRKQELPRDVSNVRDRALAIQQEVNIFCASSRGSLTLIQGRIMELVSAVEKLET